MKIIRVRNKLPYSMYEFAINPPNKNCRIINVNYIENELGWYIDTFWEELEFCEEYWEEVK